jgi:predicted dehydrogenase
VGSRRAGVLGTPYFASVVGTAGYWHPSHGLQSEWMYRQDEGGGYLNGMASHELDYIQTLLGRAVEVTADVRTSVGRRERADGSILDVDADDTSVLVLRMESGALVTVATSVVGSHANTAAFEILGSEHVVRAERDEHGGVRFVHAAPSDPAFVPIDATPRALRSGVEWPAGKVSSASRYAMAVMLEEWLPALDGSPSRVATVREAWTVQCIIDAARRSSAGDGWVRLHANG